MFAKLAVGVGPDAPHWRREGWRCNDVREFEGVDVLGPCWDLSSIPDNSLAEVLARGVLEHLTYAEVERSFREWLRVLVPGGYFTADVPDLEEYVRRYVQIVQHPETSRGESGLIDSREPDDFAACSGAERWLRRALYGWQRWPGDEHRSGWTDRLLEHYARRVSSVYEMRKMAISFEEDLSGEHMRNLYVGVWK